MTESLINSRSTAAWGVLLRSMAIGLICGLVLFFAVFETVSLTSGAKARTETSTAMWTFAPAIDHALPAIATVIAVHGENPEGYITKVSRFRNAGPWANEISGTGVAVGPEGPLITSRRLVEGATAITVCYRRGELCYGAHVLGADPTTDLALLSVEGGDLPFLKLGDSSRIEVGDLTMAIGNPFTDGASVTLSTISAVATNESGECYGFLQTLHGTQSRTGGEALINIHGELIGFHSSPASIHEGSHPLAIPSNLARQVMDRILAGMRSKENRIANSTI